MASTSTNMKSTAEQEMRNALNTVTYAQQKDALMYGNERGLHLLANVDETKTEVERQGQLLKSAMKQISDLQNEMGAMKNQNSNLEKRVDELASESKAHHGDAITDALLYEQGYRTDSYTIKKIYGLAYGDIVSQSRRSDIQTISILNQRATMYVGNGVPAKVDEAFREYVEQLDNPQDRQDEELSDKINQLHAKFWLECNSCKE
ncbi:hypothetical protein FQN50_005934 [Emmonsiellopsis sp. PD_5]|nr:hypothetical protein FQN50_005934 [Emmonsiellopsis sp. PD_5]